MWTESGNLELESIPRKEGDLRAEWRAVAAQEFGHIASTMRRKRPLFRPATARVNRRTAEMCTSFPQSRQRLPIYCACSITSCTRVTPLKVLLSSR